MISNYLEDVNTLPEQVEINKQDIKNLKNYIKEAYKCTIPLGQEPQSVQLSATNAPSGTSTGWLLDTNANLFKIVGNETIGTELLVIIFYCSLKGAQGETGETGNGITGIEEISDEIVGTQTLTTLRAHYTNGKSDDFIVYAENGSGGSLYKHTMTFNHTRNSSDGHYSANVIIEFICSKETSFNALSGGTNSVRQFLNDKGISSSLDLVATGKICPDTTEEVPKYFNVCKFVLQLSNYSNLYGTYYTQDDGITIYKKEGNDTITNFIDRVTKSV